MRKFKKEEIPSYESSLKSSETEEPVDLLFYRPIGYRVAKWCMYLGIAPNTVTIVSIFLGILAGLLFYPDNLMINVIGMILLVSANLLDSVDGQLARMSKHYSNLGRILDGAAGDFWFATIYLAIIFRGVIIEGWDYWLIIIAILAGYSHIKQAAMADYFRHGHLYFLNPLTHKEWSRSEDIAEYLNTLTWKDHFLDKCFTYVYLNYTINQEKATPTMQKFLFLIRKQYHGTCPEALGNYYLQNTRSFVGLTNILSFNTRVMALFISLAIGIPWLYFVFEITVLNVILIIMLRKYEMKITLMHHQLQSILCPNEKV